MHSQQIIQFGEALEGRDYPNPEPTGTQVLMKVDACGVCHSDLHIWDGYFDLGGGQQITLAERGVNLPFTLGHEVVGEVIGFGEEAEDVTIGDKRVVYPWIGCGQCRACDNDEELLCATPVTVGTRRDGGYSDHVLVPHPRYLIDYEGVPVDLACTYACSGLTAYSALKKVSHIQKSDAVVLIGAGGVGLSAVHFAPSVVAGSVIVADTDPTKRSVARQAGAHDTIDNSAADAVEKVHALTEGGAAAAIDFVGAPATAQFGLNCLRKGGKLVSVGLYGDAMPLPLALMPLAVRTIQGSYVGTLDEMHELMALVKAGNIPPIPYHTRPLDEATQALQDLKDGKVVGRVVLKP